MADPRIAAETVAEAYLALLKRRGIDYLYVNAGTDSPSLIEAYARQPESGLDLPTPIVAAHENLALGMAHGCWLVARRPQAVMVHVSVGAANALCALMNAARDQCPVLFTAGRTPLFEEGRFGARSAQIHWAQELFDQGAMARELVKWDYELRGGIQLQAVVDRALAIAMSEPRGPVYLTLPREVLAQKLDGLETVAAAPTVPLPPAPDLAAIEQLADWLAQAEFPLIVCTATGGDVATVPLLARIAERFGIGVVESKSRSVSLPGDHPLHLGFALEPLLSEADALLLLESDVPWLPRAGRPRPDAKVAQAGVDPLFARYPMRSFRSDLTLTATPLALLVALEAALERHRGHGGIDARRARLAERAAAVREEAAARAAQDRARGGPITKTFLSCALAAVRPADSILVNEYWLMREHVRLVQPGTYFLYPPAAGLGWGLPAALGAQQAAPGRVVIAALGDGAYLFANPAVCHQAAAMHGLPVLTVLCNNARWGAVESAALRMYPQGHASKRNRLPLTALEPAPEYERYVEASGGWGARVESRERLQPVLAEAVRVVREERRQALVNVICE